MGQYLQFTNPNLDLSLAYTGTYNLLLVAVSVFTAIFASFVALQISERVTHAHARAHKIAWVTSGGISLGGGVWAMHFIGMLAFSLPCGIAYDPIVTLASMAPGVLASVFALWFVSFSKITSKLLLVAGVIMGAGIGLMHYSGMAAMRMDAIIYYSPPWFALSIVTAVSLAVISLYAKCGIRKWQPHWASWQQSIVAAPFMGGAMAGMHYVAMEAAFFIPVSTPEESIIGFAPTILAVGIGVVTALIILLAFVSSLLGKYMENTKLLEKRSAELWVAMQAAEDMARTDPLTGMNNRLSFFEKSDSIHKLACRHNRAYAVITFDIDFFKQINDTHGHHIGDEALKALAKVVHETVRETDVAGRIGGEEFAVILPETSQENAGLLAERLRHNISQIVVQKGDANITFKASFGIAYHIQKEDRFEDILEWADEALYEAKKTGRNKVVTHQGCCD